MRGGVEGVVGAFIVHPGLRFLQAAQHFHPAGALGGVLREGIDRVQQVGGVRAAVGVDAQIADALWLRHGGQGRVVAFFLPVPAPVRARFSKLVGREDRFHRVHEWLDSIDHEILLEVIEIYRQPYFTFFCYPLALTFQIGFTTLKSKKDSLCLLKWSSRI